MARNCGHCAHTRAAAFRIKIKNKMASKRAPTKRSSGLKVKVVCGKLECH